MKLKQIFILIAVLAVLLTGVFVKNSQQPSELATQEYASLDLSFETEQVAKIIISRKKTAENEKGEDRVEVVRGSKGWEIKTLFGARGDQTRIEGLLNQIKNAEGEERGQGKDLFTDFAITDDQGFHVTLSDASGKELLGIVLGAKKAGGKSVFMRKKGADRIYLLSADLLAALGLYGEIEKESPKNDYWVSNAFLSFDGAKVNRFTTSRFQGSAETVTSSIVKEAGQWKFPAEKYPSVIDPQRVSEFLNHLKTWVAQKTLDPKAKDYGFSSPLWTMKIGVEGESEIAVTVGAFSEELAAYYIQVSGEPVVYQLAKYFFENMDIDDSKFFKEKVLGELTAQNVESLAVFSGKETFSVKPAEKNWPDMEAYLKDMSGLRIARLVWDAKEKKNFSPKNRFEIKLKDQEPAAFEFGDLIADKQEYLARKKGNGIIFAVSENAFKNIFETAGRLKEPEPVKPAAAPAS